MNRLTEYILYVAIGAGMATCMGCSRKEQPSTSPNGLESRIIAIEPIYDEPRIEFIGIEPVYDESKR